MGEGLFDGEGFVQQTRNRLTMSEITPVRLQLKALWNPFRSEGDILEGIFFLKLFDMIPFPMIFSTLQLNQILGEIDIIALISIQFGLHPRRLPIHLFHHCLRHPSNLRGRPFSLKIVKQILTTFYHISPSNWRKEKCILSLIREEA